MNLFKIEKTYTLTISWNKLYQTFELARLATNTWVLDNEISGVLQNSTLKNKTSFQLVPPHIYPANVAERAFQIFKYYFKVGIAFFDPDVHITE